MITGPAALLGQGGSLLLKYLAIQETSRLSAAKAQGEMREKLATLKMPLPKCGSPPRI